MNALHTSPPLTFVLDGFMGGHSRWERLRKKIAASVGPCRIWRYDSSGHSSLESIGTDLRKELESVPEPINLVGYSMGGIIIREAVRSLSRPVERVALLHSPHGGTLGGYLFPNRLACREMLPGSSFLRRLNESKWNTPTLATWCPLDAVVIPGISAKWPRATRKLQCLMPAHAWPIISPGIHRQVVRFLLGENS